MSSGIGLGDKILITRCACVMCHTLGPDGECGWGAEFMMRVGTVRAVYGRFEFADVESFGVTLDDYDGADGVMLSVKSTECIKLTEKVGDE